jgi:hypothetical protein
MKLNLAPTDQWLENELHKLLVLEAGQYAFFAKNHMEDKAEELEYLVIDDEEIIGNGQGGDRAICFEFEDGSIFYQTNGGTEVWADLDIFKEYYKLGKYSDNYTE